MQVRVRAGVVAAMVVLGPRPADAQALPSEPIPLADGRVVIGGEASVSTSSHDDNLAWFNYTDYEHNALRMIRLGLSADVRLSSRVSLLAQLRTDNWDALRPYALYVRVKPFARRALDVQVGRIPPTFGAFARRAYAGADNPVIGYPLAYQYLTSLRTDAVPETADDLLRMRARGWRPSFPLGSAEVSTGLPIISAFRWDTGVQVRIGSAPLEVSASVTAGTLSEPRVRDDNSGRQVAVRVGWTPVVGLVLGASGARGPYLAQAVTRALPADGSRTDFRQQAFGFDAEYSRDHWLLRAEGIVSDWRVPSTRPPRIEDGVRAWSMSIEGRYHVWPGVFAAGRYDHLGFSALQGSAATLAWDAPVTRVEVGGGYSLQRNLIGKVTYQYNWRETGLTRRLGVWAGQLQYWF